MTEVVSVMIQMVWLIIQMVWLTKKLLSALTATMNGRPTPLG